MVREGTHIKFKAHLITASTAARLFSKDAHSGRCHKAIAATISTRSMFPMQIGHNRLKVYTTSFQAAQTASSIGLAISSRPPPSLNLRKCNRKTKHDRQPYNARCFNAKLVSFGQQYFIHLLSSFKSANTSIHFFNIGMYSLGSRMASTGNATEENHLTGNTPDNRPAKPVSAVISIYDKTQDLRL